MALLSFPRKFSGFIDTCITVPARLDNVWSAMLSFLRSIPSPGERVPAEERVFAQAMKQSNCRGENGRLAEAWPGPRNTNLRSST